MKFGVHLIFFFDSLSLACYHENNAWICHVHGLMLLLICSLIISGIFRSWAKLDVVLISARFRIYVVLYWKLMMDCCLPCLAEPFCVFNLDFWKFFIKTRFEKMKLLLCDINPNPNWSLAQNLPVERMHGTVEPC